MVWLHPFPSQIYILDAKEGRQQTPAGTVTMRYWSESNIGERPVMRAYHTAYNESLPDHGENPSFLIPSPSFSDCLAEVLFFFFHSLLSERLLLKAIRVKARSLKGDVRKMKEFRGWEQKPASFKINELLYQHNTLKFSI